MVTTRDILSSGGQARRIDGKAEAARLTAEVAAAVATLKARHDLTPGLAVVIVGEDPASQIYVRNKGERSREAGMLSLTHRLPESATEAELLALVEQLNDDPSIHGILVQLPLPPQIDSAAVLAAISPDKDVDGFHVVNAGRLATGQAGLVSCTPLGCLILLRRTLGELRAGRLWWSGAPTSWASPWPSCCSRRTAR